MILLFRLVVVLVLPQVAAAAANDDDWDLKTDSTEIFRRINGGINILVKAHGQLCMMKVDPGMNVGSLRQIVEERFQSSLNQWCLQLNNNNSAAWSCDFLETVGEVTTSTSL